MQTFEEQASFFDQYWPDLQAALEQGGVPRCVQVIEQVKDDLERRVLFMFGARAISDREWSGRSREAQIAFAQAAIAEMLRQAEAAPDAETRDRRIDSANVVSYNLSADLAFCFDDNGVPRSRQHYEYGLKAAQDCLAWRRQLHKGPVPFSLAYWASGAHRLALDDATGARKDFTEALRCSIQAAEEAKAVTTVSPQAGFAILLNNGFIALAQLATGDATARVLLECVLDAFRQQVQNGDAETSADASFGLDQLERAQAWLKL